MFKTVIVQRVNISKKSSNIDSPNKFHLHNSVVNKDKCLVKVILFINSLIGRVRSSKQVS